MMKNKNYLKMDKLFNCGIALNIECTADYSYCTGSISEIHERLLENGYRVSKNALRRWVKDGILPAAYSGEKAWINYDNVLDLLKNGTPVVNREAIPVKGVRKIN